MNKTLKTRAVALRSEIPQSKIPSIFSWRVPALLSVVLVQSACAAALVATPLLMDTEVMSPFHSAVDSAAEKRLQEEYARKYPGVDIADDYALGKAMFEEAKRENPEQMKGLKMPPRAEWEANHAKLTGTSATTAGAAAAASAKAPVSSVSVSKIAQDESALKKASASWVAVTKSWPHDAVNFSSVAPHACGLKKISFSINGGASKIQAFSPCSARASEPNPPYWTFPQNSVETVSVTFTYASGKRQTRKFTRDQVFEP